MEILILIIDIYATKHKIFWQDDDISYSGIPYVVASQKCFDCQYGVDRNKEAKNERKRKQDEALVGVLEIIVLFYRLCLSTLTIRFEKESFSILV